MSYKDYLEKCRECAFNVMKGKYSRAGIDLMMSDMKEYWLTDFEVETAVEVEMSHIVMSY
jgi:hypothetical protein